VFRSFATIEAGWPRSSPRIHSILILLLRTDRVAVGVAIAAAVISVIISVCSRCRCTGCRAVSGSPPDPAPDRRARDRATGVAASRDAVSSAGMNRPTAEVGGSSVKAAATPITATTAPTSERVIWKHAGTDESDCC
jgi:hypothetical protein